MKKIIAVSGGFDPIHMGHIRMIREAAKLGDVVVILNSDDWLKRKKSYSFMPWEQRAEIIQEFASVEIVSSFDDSDDTACAAIQKFRPAAFANGGDRYESNTPEMDVCNELGIEMLWNIGGEKEQSSSALVDDIRFKTGV